MSREQWIKEIVDAVKLWIEEERMVLVEIHHVLHEAGKRLYSGRNMVRSLPVSTMPPSELIAALRPSTSNRDKDEIIPNPDYWAEWLARWLAVSLPRQDELRDKVLRNLSEWAK